MVLFLNQLSNLLIAQQTLADHVMMLDLRKQKLDMDTSYKFILKCNSVQIVNRLEVNRGGGAFVSALGCERTGSHNARDKRQNCRLSHARVKIWSVHTGSVRACDKYEWHHIHWNMASYLLEYDNIFIGIWYHIC